jgi:hypothetical protein
MPHWKPTRKFSDGKFLMYQAVPQQTSQQTRSQVKTKAEGLASHLRKTGNKARVTPYKHGYTVWYKEK